MALFHIVENVIEGNEPAIDIAHKLEELAGIDVTKAEDAVELFARQFLTPFGQQALALAGTAIAQFASGTPIKTIEASVVPQITADAVTDAEKAGEVTLNAIRVQMVAATTVPVVPVDAPVAPTA